jgi:hypothetical protein
MRVLNPVWEEFRRKMKQWFEGGWKEAWREALEEAARDPQWMGENLSWAEYERRYQMVREEIFEALREDDLAPLLYYMRVYKDFLLKEEPVGPVVLRLLSTAASDKKASENLKELVAVVGRYVGRPRLSEDELPEAEKPKSPAEASSSTEAAKRMMRRYDEEREAGRRAAEEAYRNVVYAFVAESRMEIGRIKSALSLFGRKIKKEDPSLSSLVKRRIWRLPLSTRNPN